MRGDKHAVYTGDMNIAIAGFGAEGRTSYEYWNTPEHDVVIVNESEIAADQLPIDTNVITGEDAFGKLNGFDMVIRSPGVSPHKIQTDGMVWSATNEFFRQCPAPIIGVTGSKGKGTTSSLIASVLRAAGYTVHLVGNIGLPALSQLSEISSSDVVVYELSSFQLWDAVRSPHHAVVLHIEPDHLDVHEDFDEYVNAKASIVRYQTRSDTCVYHPTNQWSHQIAAQQPQFATHAAKYATLESGNDELETVYVYEGKFVTTKGRVLCSVDELKLPGAHNVDNACAALSVCMRFDVSDAQCAEGLGAFTGLPHRLKYVDTINDVRYYDDSIATTPGSAIAALAAFDAPKVILLGGSYKGADFAELAAAVAKSDVRKVLLIGAEASRIAGALDAAGCDNYEQTSGDMASIVKRAAEVAESGDVVVLSPACASFGDFKNYQDRGDQFIAAVKGL